MIFFNTNEILEYSFSTTRAMSGMENNSTAFVGCDDGYVSILTTKLDIVCTVPPARKLFSIRKGFSLKDKASELFIGQKIETSQ